MLLSDLAKILSLAVVLTRLSNGEPRNSLIALAWTFRNRAGKHTSFTRNIVSGFNARFLNGVKIQETGSPKVNARNFLTLLKPRSDDSYCRSLAIASLVWCGDEADPTAGSTHFHRHDEWPEWAKKSEPVALIGNWLFYNDISFNS